MKIVLIDTKNPKAEIEILMTGTKLAACHQKMADCDDLQVCSKLVLNFENYCSMAMKTTMESKTISLYICRGNRIHILNC